MRRANPKLQEEVKAKREEKKKRKKPNINVNLEILDKICSSEAYTDKVVTTVAQVFARKYGLEESSQVEVLLRLDSTFSQLEKILKKLLKSHDLFEKPRYFLLGRGIGWATLVLTKNESEAEKKVQILYKDFTTGMTKGVEQILSRVFSGGIKFTVNLEGTFPPSESGALSLKWIQMVVNGLQSQEREKFISEFPKMTLASKSDEVDVGKLKTDLKVELVAHTIEKMLSEIEIDEEAKKLIGSCIALCKNARDNLGKQVSSYERILKEEMAKLEENPEYEIDEEKILNAQKELKGKLGEEDQAEMQKLIKAVPQFKDLKEEPKKEKDGESKENASDENLKEEEEKNRPFKVFRKCVRMLKGAEETESLQKLLSSIEAKFELLSGALIEYFHTLEKEKIVGGDNSDNLESLNELVSKLPPMRETKGSGSPDPRVKSMDQLLAEFSEEKELNSEDLGGQGMEIFKKKYLENQEVLEMKKDYDDVKAQFEKWKDADVPTINSWANGVRGHLDSYVEGIAVMDRVFQLTTGGFRMRDPQLFSVIWFIRQSNAGKLAQISTGEGKTVIIGVISSIMVLQGKTVDVLTSNEVLAQEGVDEMKTFYNILGISAATNNEEDAASKKKINSDKPTPRTCYSADVVYGTITSFQFDHLRDTSEGQQTRGKRSFGIVILDEVDNLSVDNGGNIAKLAKPFPGMECLKYIYIKIWEELAKAEGQIAKDFLEKLKEKGKELEVKAENKDLEDEYEKYQIQLIAKYADELKLHIKASNPCDIKLIHRHLRPYCSSMLDKWIDNALFAKFECREREMYIIKKVGEEDAVVPVDFANTGVTMENTQWSNGLHQFVQLKHNLRITCESLTSSFISNIGYIKLYESKNIFGLTGTLGSLAAREMLQSAYNVTFKVFPRYKTYNLAMFESMVVLDSQWTNLVAMEAVLEAVGRGRAVLIICKTIKDMDIISKNVQACLNLEEYKADYVKVKTYLDEDESAVVKEKVGPREIIIATNIAGRGTNFKTTKELEAAGGLHVIVGFLPYNKRVQDQAFGRTARQGNQGSAQLILRKQDVLEIDLDPDPDDDDNDDHQSILTMDEILEKRDEIERKRLKNIKERKLSEIIFNDELFTKFSALYRDFNSKNGETIGSSYVTADLKEFWAFWLHKQEYDFDKIKSSNVTNEFERFEREAESILKNCEIIWNPFNEIRRGTMFLHINDLEKGEKAVRRGIEMCKDDALCSSGYMKLFDIEIEKGAQLMERFKKALASLIWIPLKKDETYKANAKAALEKAVVGLEKEVSYLNATLSHQDFQQILMYTNGKNLLLTHLNGRLAALSTLHEHAKSLLRRLTDSGESETTGLAIGSRIPHYLKKLDEKVEDEKKLKESLTSEELDELQWIGLETLYSLRDVHDAHKETIIGAQVQIGTGLACLAGGFFFPPAMVVLGPIAGALISEGICDIVVELLSRGYTGFDVKSYVKGKCISFGIALATMGISALATSVKLLDKAAKACRSLANLLRKCPFLKGVCQKLAGQVDRLANYFDKLKLIAQFGKMKDAEKLNFLKKLKATGEIQKLKQLDGLAKLGQLEHLKSLGKLDVISKTQLLKSAVISVGKETVQSVTMSLITEHLVTAGLNLILEGIRPSIEKMVREGLKEAKLRDTIKMVESRSETEKLMMEVLEGSYGEMAGEVIQEIALGVARQSGNWKLKLTSLTLDTALSLNKIFKYTSSFCKRFKVAVASNTRSESNSDLKEKEDLVATLVTDKVYRLIMELAGKHAATLVVGPLMSKVLSSIGKEKKNAEVDEANEKTLAQIEDAFETLKLSPGATLEEVKKAYREASLQTHPDKPGGDHGKFLEVGEAYQFIRKLHSDLESPLSYRPKTRLLLGPPAGWKNPSLDDSTISKSDPGDGGNIATLSLQLKQHIIVQCFDETGLTVTKVEEFGRKYKDGDNPSAVIGFLPPTIKNGGIGHFVQLGEDGTPIPNKIYNVKPSPGNNCLYESLAPQMKGGAMTPHELRIIGETTSLANVTYATGSLAVNLLKNPLTLKLYIKARSSLLIGGSLNLANEAIPKFVEAVRKIVEINSQTFQYTNMTLREACKGNEKAIAAIKKHSTTVVGSLESTSVKCYSIDGMDSLTNFILNHNHDNKPFVLQYPNGVKSVFAGDLYSLMAYTGDEVHVGVSQYKKFGGTALESLKAITDPNSQMPLENYPEISGRLISESIRHPATFMSLCWALDMNINSKIAGDEKGLDGSGNLCVTTTTGIMWLKPEKPGDYLVENAKNPLWLLGRHILRADHDKNIGQIWKACVREITKNRDPNANPKDLLADMTPEQKASFDMIFYQQLYKKMRKVLTEYKD